MGGSSTNAPIVLAIFAFYTFIIVMMGFVGASYSDAGTTSTISTDVDAPTTNPLTVYDFVSVFFGGIGFSLSALGVWNVLLFFPLGLTIAYIIASFVRGTA